MTAPAETANNVACNASTVPMPTVSNRPPSQIAPSEMNIVTTVVSVTVRWMSMRVIRFIIAARDGSVADCSNAMTIPKATTIQ